MNLDYSDSTLFSVSNMLAHTKLAPRTLGDNPLSVICSGCSPRMAIEEARTDFARNPKRLTCFDVARDFIIENLNLAEWQIGSRGTNSKAARKIER